MPPEILHPQDVAVPKDLTIPAVFLPVERERIPKVNPIGRLVR
jgi:hypothetical protein